MIWSYGAAISRRLLGWSVLSVVAGIGLIGWGEGFWQAFGIQAVAWGLIDAVIATVGLVAKRTRSAAEQRAWLRRVLWINAGLDVVYIAVGGAAVAWGGGHPGWAGHGWGVIVQGAFLLLFDAWHAWRMPAEMALPPGRLFPGPEHQTFVWEAGPDAPVAVLLHGFPGSPAEVAPAGRALHAAGWSVHGLLLPGFGSDIASLGDQRYADWVTFVRRYAEGVRRPSRPLALLGYSFGGALATDVAATMPVDRLILIAPFAWVEPWWVAPLLFVLGPIVPYAVKPYARANPNDPKFAHGMGKFMPGVDMTDPEVRARLKAFQVPAGILAEVRRTAGARRSAERVTTPTLIVQGRHDQVSRPENIARLRSRLPAVEVLEVDAGHDLIEADNPSWPGVAEEIVRFADA
jgi:carboxylesterase